MCRSEQSIHTLRSCIPDVRGITETSLFQIAWQQDDVAERTRRILTDTPWSRDARFSGRLRKYLIELASPLLSRRRPALGLPVESRPSSLGDLPFREAQALNLAAPILIRFQDLLRHRVETLLKLP
jgi:hypothetical protein